MYTQNILVAENESIIALNIEKILLKKGYNVIGIARTGEEAINIALQKEPDLILMDIMLDGRLNGIETAERIIEKYKIPIIYLTAFNDDETFLHAYKTRPHEFITKPFNEKKLISSIENLFNGKFS